MESGAVLSLDQAAPAHQSFLWHFAERSQDANLDWIAVYVLVAIVKKRLNLEKSLHSILQILSVSLFEKMPIYQALLQPVCETMDPQAHNQLILFN